MDQVNTPTVVSYKTEKGIAYGVVSNITQARVYIVLAAHPGSVKKLPIGELKYMRVVDPKAQYLRHLLSKVRR